MKLLRTVAFVALAGAVAADLTSNSSSSSGEDPYTSFWPYGGTWSAQLILIAFYGAILAFGAKLIGDGSELLLEILDPGLIGALLLPVLGALPDSAVVLVSGALGKPDAAQTQISVGMGTLAGSTIMLLTVTWSASLFLGRCDLRGGESVDKTLTRRFDLFNTGITVDTDTLVNARVMLVTSLSYFIVQGVGFAYLTDASAGKRIERPFALAGGIVCTTLLIAYCVYQLLNPKLQERKIQKAKEEYMVQQAVSRMMSLMKAKTAPSDVETAPLVPAPDVRKVGLAWKKKAAEKAENRVDINKDKGSSSEEEEKPSGTKTQIALRAAATLAIGTALVAVFSDPIVGVIGDFATTLHIKPFYVSFLITPYCSNASELISSLMFAAGKKRKNASLTYGQIYGAATMNNTMVLGIFFFLIYARGLFWEFSAETLSICLVTWAIGIPGAFLQTLRSYFVLWGALLYPLSLFFVWALENWGHFQ